MERMPIYALNDCNSTGIDKVPVKKLMLNKQTGGLFNLADRTGLTNTLKFKDFTGKFFSMEPADFDDVCPAIPPFTVTVPTNFLILFDFPYDMPGYPHAYSTNGGVYGARLYEMTNIVNPNNPCQVIRANGTIYNGASPFVTAADAILYPDGTYIIPTSSAAENEKQLIIDEFQPQGYLIWDRTTRTCS